MKKVILFFLIFFFTKSDLISQCDVSFSFDSCIYVNQNINFSNTSSEASNPNADWNWIVDGPGLSNV